MALRNLYKHSNGVWYIEFTNAAGKVAHTIKNYLGYGTAIYSWAIKHKYCIGTARIGK